MTALRSMIMSQFVGWIAVAGLCVYMLMPLRDTLRLGMDLAGGTYLTVMVHVDKAVEGELIERMHAIEAKIKAVQLGMPIFKQVENSVIELRFENSAAANEVAILIKDDFPELNQKSESNTLFLTLHDAKVQRIKEDAVMRNIGVLRTRIDPYGAAEISIAQQGTRNIIIELPDVAKTAETKARIGKSAQLDFRIVERVGSSQDDILIEYDGELPAGKLILPGKRKGSEQPTFYLVSRYTDITGKYLKDARPSFGGDSGMEPAVGFTFNPEGAQKFYDLTSKNVGRLIAIILDDVVISAGRIKSPIRESGSISGGFRDAKETRELSVLLQSGSYVAPVTVEQERQIGPSLGYESIRKGIISCIVGLLLVMLFAVIYYGFAGFLAFLALGFNLLLILFGLSCLRATLTLPGIAGMVLTVGMAIDASILIYEHIKQELRKGVALKMAIAAGFSGAMTVILDANITTFIVGVVLYNTGSGPIQGFAVTMMLGILATLITGLFFLRSMFSFIVHNFNMQKLGF